MSEHHPRIRVQVEGGALLIREGLSITFYMRHSHAAVARAVLHSLELYRRAVHPHEFRQYSNEVGASLRLDEAGWERNRLDLLDDHSAIIQMNAGAVGQSEYQFVYFGRPIDEPLPWENAADRVCAVSFWLPTEYLQEHGPGQMRELALELGAPLPFCSGHAGLAFHCDTRIMGTWREVSKSCFRYPGMEIPTPNLLSLELGTRVRTVNWLTFLGQPVLGEVGGVAGLRSRLHSPGTTVQELEAERAVITLGPWPEAGDTQQGKVLPAYRELARVLEPWLYQEKLRSRLPADHEVLRWERRFLD
ncbi:MAG TPA: DUF3396 domain-containing protein [Archangium sp.]|nr:DUF3396 domain-containing protein [Archangium sp.]